MGKIKERVKIIDKKERRNKKIKKKGCKVGR
jgi:hypothetical protein